MKELQGVFHRVVSRVSAVTLPAPADGAGRIPIRARNVTVAVITRLVRLSSRYAWPTILTFLLLAVVSATYFTRHFAIVTDSKELLSSSLPWRQQERMLHDAFPQRIDQIIAVIDASTPEAADDAAEALVHGLASRPDAIRSVSRPDGGEFFDARRVREMFARISPRYDLLNHLLSGYIDTRWRRKVVKKLKPLVAPNARLLDVACGTGDLSIEFFEQTNARITGLDFCRPMLELAQRKTRDIAFIEGDALRLPFADETFDAITIGFGLRNLSSVESGLSELRRALKPNGWLAILEFSQPTNSVMRGWVKFYYGGVLPLIGGWLSGSRSAYEYLPDSISHFPNQERLATLMREAGFGDVSFENLTGGVAALHIGRRS